MRTKKQEVAWFDCEKCGRSEIDHRSSRCVGGCLFTIPVYWYVDRKVTKEEHAAINDAVCIEGAD
jgi:hypothetical protein